MLVSWFPGFLRLVKLANEFVPGSLYGKVRFGRLSGSILITLLMNCWSLFSNPQLGTGSMSQFDKAIEWPLGMNSPWQWPTDDPCQSEDMTRGWYGPVVLFVGIAVVKLSGPLLPSTSVTKVEAWLVILSPEEVAWHGCDDLTVCWSRSRIRHGSSSGTVSRRTGSDGCSW